MKYSFRSTAFRVFGFTAYLAAVILFVALISLNAQCGEVRDCVVRLHILANSDTQADQAVKLAVRDAVLSSSTALFDGSTDAENARIAVEKNREIIEKAANSVLQASGVDYKAKLVFTEEFFDTREYDGFTMPAGRYKAVKLILGDGAGKNWWCVMFPPLCLPAASESADIDVFFSGNAKVIEGSRYQIRFKIVEVIEKIKNSINA
ncbi:MAG: stage II sporulation protein R [Clostridia bacterium]|nr:stage II sporulation protein R [Clostridia bacterium]